MKQEMSIAKIKNDVSTKEQIQKRHIFIIQRIEPKRDTDRFWDSCVNTRCEIFKFKGDNYILSLFSCFLCVEVKESLFLARNGCNVFVFTLSCFLAKFVRYIEEDEERCQQFLHKGFIGSMEYRVCVCTASRMEKGKM